MQHFQYSLQMHINMLFVPVVPSFHQRLVLDSPTVYTLQIHFETSYMELAWEGS